MSPFEEICALLDTHGKQYDVTEHHAVFTCEDAAKARGVPLHQGAKALLLKVDAQYILVVMSAARKLDSNKLRSFLKVSRLRFATPDEVTSMMHCRIGSCYPFGNIIGLPVYCDRSLLINDFISFNPGVHEKSLTMRLVDYLELVRPELVDISS